MFDSGNLKFEDYKPHYSASVRFWYVVYNLAGRLHKWVWRSKIQPWHAADRVSRPQVAPHYHQVAVIPATDQDRARGIAERRVYVSRPQ